MADPRKVFVVHGRNDAARKAVVDFLLSIHLWPLEWHEVAHETGNASPFIYEILEKGFEIAQAIIVILTPDEIVELQPALRTEEDDGRQRYQPRPNVLFEAGMAFMRDRNRTILLEFGSIAQASDLHGIHALRVARSAGAEFRSILADRLETAGCTPSRKGQNWLTAGNFEAAFINPTSPAGQARNSLGARPKRALSFHRSGTLDVSSDEFKFKAILVVLENTGNRRIDGVYCLCKVRGGPGSGVEGNLIKQIKVPFVNWSEEVIDGEPDLIVGDSIRVPLVGAVFDPVKDATIFWLLTGQQSATHVSEPNNAITFEFTIGYVGGNETLKLTPLSVTKDIVRYSMEINSVKEEIELEFKDKSAQ
jgi:CAP12/Pycsar effector protein, TIR domain